MLAKALLSSESVEWETPQALFDELNAEFHFTLDVCATKENAKCKKFYTREQNGLLWKWTGECVWCNPPYGRVVRNWVERCAGRRQPEAHYRAVMLLPVRTDVRWWHEFIWDAERHSPRTHVQVRFLKGRLHFNRSATPAPFPSCVVVFT